MPALSMTFSTKFCSPTSNEERKAKAALVGESFAVSFKITNTSFNDGEIKACFLKFCGMNVLYIDGHAAYHKRVPEAIFVTKAINQQYY